MYRPGRRSRPPTLPGATVPAVTKSLGILGGGFLGGGLLISLIFSYSGNADVMFVGSFVLLVTGPLGLLLLLGCLISFLVSRSSSPAAAGPASAGASFPEQRLAALKRMHEAGDLSDEEYETKRQQVIREM